MKKLAKLFILLLLVSVTASADTLVQKVAESLLFQGQASALKLLKDSPDSARQNEQIQQAVASTDDVPISRLRALMFLELLRISRGGSAETKAAEAFMARARALEALLDKANKETLSGNMNAVQQTVRDGGKDLYYWVNWSRDIHKSGPRGDKLNVVYAMAFIADPTLPVYVSEESMETHIDDLGEALPYNSPITPAERAAGLDRSVHWKTADYLARVGAYARALELLARIEDKTPMVELRKNILGAEIGRRSVSNLPEGLGKEEHLYWILAKLKESEETGSLEDVERLAVEGLRLSKDSPLYAFCFHSTLQRIRQFRGELRSRESYEEEFKRTIQQLTHVAASAKAEPLVWKRVGENLNSWEQGWTDRALGFTVFEPFQRELDLLFHKFSANPEVTRDAVWRGEMGRAELDNLRSSLDSAIALLNTTFPEAAHVYNTRLGLVDLALAELDLDTSPEEALKRVKSAIQSLRAGTDRRILDDALLREIEIIVKYKLKPRIDQALRASQTLAKSPRLDTRVRAKILLAQILDYQGVRQEAREVLQSALSEVEQLALESRGGAGALRHMKERYSALFELQAVWAFEAKETAVALSMMEKEALLHKVVSTPLPEQTDVAWQKQKIENLKKTLATGTGPIDEEAAKKALSAARKELSAMLSRLQADPKYRRLLFTTPADIKDIQETLPPDSLLVQHLPSRTRDKVFILALTRESVSAREYPLRVSQLERDIQTLRERLIRQSPTDNRIAFGLLDKLYAQLIKPIEPELQGKKTLIIASSGILNHLPFQALINKPQQGPAKFLIQDHAVVYSLRAGDLARIKKPASPFPAKGRWSVFGNPDGTLPGAERESLALKQLNPGTKLYLRSQASENALEQVAGSTDVLHLATHGTLVDRNPDQSFLVMSDGRGGGEALTRQEILGRLDLKGTNLVTLSACQTALSGTRIGTEVNSLADAFWSKGAGAVVGSLWSVPDVATKALMTEYYSRLSQGENHARAFRKAQLALLENRQTAHPFYWSSFIFWGDFR